MTDDYKPTDNGIAERRERGERDGMHPHGGFAIGLERITAYTASTATNEEEIKIDRRKDKKKKKELFPLICRR